MLKHNLDWNKCVDVFTPNCTSSHCVLHWHALVARKIPSDLQNVLIEAVKMINYIKSHPLQS
ncbi:hypothetical protein PR048_002949 [Dryococelus australis]|uniref:Uncharacterized protein n=1 Tax=Dryococelus australis TaxID=614101 RepID=A0ABQ9ILL9_9NEOP|nr:hypothetical protein PR048_002949 [Dryococelus australis]